MTEVSVEASVRAVLDGLAVGVIEVDGESGGVGSSADVGNRYNDPERRTASLTKERATGTTSSCCTRA